jgi:hypothetical protein
VKVTRDEAHAYLRQGSSVWISSWEQEGIFIPTPKSVTGHEVRQYVFELERRLLALSSALADHLEGKPVKPDV